MAKISSAKSEGAIHMEIAAAYYNDRNIELERARALIESAINLREKPSPTAYNIYGIILDKLGEMDEAVKAIEFSLNLAREVGYDTLAMKNEELLKKWSKK